MGRFDVLIIGGGVVGSAIARELTRYQLRIGVLEKNLDVCYETSRTKFRSGPWWIRI